MSFSSPGDVKGARRPEPNMRSQLVLARDIRNSHVVRRFANRVSDLQLPVLVALSLRLQLLENDLTGGSEVLRY